MSSFRSPSFRAVPSSTEAISFVSYPTSLRPEIARERRPHVRKNAQNGDFVNGTQELVRFSKAVCPAGKLSFWTNGPTGEARGAICLRPGRKMAYANRQV